MKNYWLDKKNGANWMVTAPEVASVFEPAFASFAPAPSEGNPDVWIRCGDDWVWIKVPKNEVPIDAYTLEEHEKLLAKKAKS